MVQILRDSVVGLALVCCAAPVTHADERSGGGDGFFRLAPRSDVERRVAENFRTNEREQAREAAEKNRDKTHDGGLMVGRDTSVHAGGVKGGGASIGVRGRF